MIEMASSGGATFSKYFTHKCRLQIAGFHNRVELYIFTTTQRMFLEPYVINGRQLIP